MYGQAPRVRRLDKARVHIVHRGADPDRVSFRRFEVRLHSLARLLVRVEPDQRQRGVLGVDLREGGFNRSVQRFAPV